MEELRQLNPYERVGKDFYDQTGSPLRHGQYLMFISKILICKILSARETEDVVYYVNLFVFLFKKKTLAFTEEI